ncbi:hypothetical protein LEN26_012437 [Aphanomyces euteiches]|nr:hypothetical protein LEN26_012437 [Aphanomyces euteiches]KAH9120534.1 hypothetical protein AeMF1_007348 [Aphanomyces euteiches]KAH9180138.1 hypothetical protein AeNC1_017218 [Aphanomyces euteiches]
MAKMPQADLSALRDEFGAAFHHEYVGFDPEFIYNLDETGMCYDMSPKIIWAVRGGSSRVSGGEKHSYRMTAVMTVRADGAKLPILFIIKGSPGGSIETDEFPTYPEGHFYAVQQRAWMNAKVWKSYLERVFAPNVEGTSILLVDNFYSPDIYGSSILLVDNFNSHVSNESYRFVQEDCGSHLVPLPPNSTSHCQPLDVAIMGPLKQHLRDLFLMETEVVTTCQEKRLVMINRAILAWGMITEEEVRASFKKALPKPTESTVSALE